MSKLNLKPKQSHHNQPKGKAEKKARLKPTDAEDLRNSSDPNDWGPNDGPHPSD